MASFPILSNKLYRRSFHTTTEKISKKKYFSKIPTQFPPQEKYLKVTISQNLEVSKTNEKKIVMKYLFKTLKARDLLLWCCNNSYEKWGLKISLK